MKQARAEKLRRKRDQVQDERALALDAKKVLTSSPPPASMSVDGGLMCKDEEAEEEKVQLDLPIDPFRTPLHEDYD